MNSIGKFLTGFYPLTLLYSSDEVVKSLIDEYAAAEKMDYVNWGNDDEDMGYDPRQPPHYSSMQ